MGTYEIVDMNLPTINVVENFVCFRFRMSLVQVFADPGHKVILEHALNNLV